MSHHHHHQHSAIATALATQPKDAIVRDFVAIGIADWPSIASLHCSADSRPRVQTDRFVATILHFERQQIATSIFALTRQLASDAHVTAVRTVSRSADHHAIDVEFSASGTPQLTTVADALVLQRVSLLRTRKRAAVFHLASLVLSNGDGLVAGAIELCNVLKRLLGVHLVLIGAEVADSMRRALQIDSVVADAEAFVHLCHAKRFELADCVAINVAAPPAAIGLAIDLPPQRDLVFVLPLLGFALDDLHLRPRFVPSDSPRVVSITDKSVAAVLASLSDHADVDDLRCESVGDVAVALATHKSGAASGARSKTADHKRYAVSILGATLTFSFLSLVVNAIETSGGAVTDARLLSDDPRDKWQCVELLVEWAPAAAEATRAVLVTLGQSHGKIDVSLQPDTFERRHKRMVVFDMDSTLIQDECIDEMGKFANVGAQIEAITRRAMNGELDFSQSLRSRVALLKDQPNRIFQHVLDTMTYTPDAKVLCAALNRLGYTLVVLSGGFTNIIDQVKRDLELRHAHGNTLLVVEDKLTGDVVGEIVDAKKKAEHLVAIARSEGIAVGQVIAIGDGANDLAMLAEAGLGVAFNAKPKVQEQAKFRINQMSMVPLAYLMGMRSSEVRTIGGQG